jgi:hypothetical protein
MPVIKKYLIHIIALVSLIFIISRVHTSVKTKEGSSSEATPSQDRSDSSAVNSLEKDPEEPGHSAESADSQTDLYIKSYKYELTDAQVATLIQNLPKKDYHAGVVSILTKSDIFKSKTHWYFYGGHQNSEILVRDGTVCEIDTARMFLCSGLAATNCDSPTPENEDCCRGIKSGRMTTFSCTLSIDPTHVTPIVNRDRTLKVLEDHGVDCKNDCPESLIHDIFIPIEG